MKCRILIRLACKIFSFIFFVAGYRITIKLLLCHLSHPDVRSTCTEQALRAVR